VSVLRISSLATEYVKAPISAVVNGVVTDPTGDVVEFSFKPIGTTPGAADWTAGSWETTGAGATAVFYARCLVGPSGNVTLALGTYIVWVRISASPQTIVLQAGTLEIVDNLTSETDVGATGGWTYDPSQLATSQKDQVRAEIGDVNVRTDGLTLVDEEINWAISVESNFWGAAARCCEILATRFLQKADVRLGRSLMVQYTTTADQYARRARELRAKNLGSVAPWVGGMVVADKQAYQQDGTLVQPLFARDMQESPWAGTQGSNASTEASDAEADFGA
jgi:hypothetical protein